MSGNHDSRLPGEQDLESRDRGPSLGLDAHSYTLNRLHHASPQHLHLTTRRCFIGPIPEAWLAKHRKAWYKYRPRLATYSSKPAAFTAGDNVTGLRKLTGLDGEIDLPGDSYGMSFPQPDDVDNPPESFNDVEDDSDNKILASDEQMLKTSGSLVGGNEENSGNERESNRSRKNSKLRRQKKSSSSGGESFVTAREEPEQAVEDNAEDGIEAENSSKSLRPRPDDNRNSYGSTIEHMSSLGGAASGLNDVGSTSSLLPHGKVDKNSSQKTQASQDVTTETAGATLEIDASHHLKSSIRKAQDRTLHQPPAEVVLDSALGEDSNSAPSLHHVEPVATGLVRFALPEDDSKAVSKPGTKVASAVTTKSTNDILKGRAEAGQLLKAERMLVRVEVTRHELPASYTENDSPKIESRLIEKWKEFIVTCRKSITKEAPYVLQMNKTRVIPMMDREHRSKKIAHEIELTRNSTNLNMYSSLDKTIVLWRRQEKETKIFILRPRSAASSVEWYTFLSSTLGWKRPTSLTVQVPDFSLSLDLERPFQELDVLQESIRNAEDNEDDTKKAATLAEGQVAKHIIDRSIHILRRSSVGNILEAWFEHGHRVGLAWKRYDRLEWVHGLNEERMYGSMAMQRTHDLELRPKLHYPTQVALRDQDKPSMQEPAPVEGFLVRLTSQKGRSRRFGKAFFKRLYFSTHNQFLCFCVPSKAVPPKPPMPHEHPDNHIPSAEEIVNKIPLIYGIDPYPVHNGRISWLADKNAGHRKDRDLAAYEESQRTMKSLLDTEGYINLCHVVRIRKVSGGSLAPAGQYGEGDGNEGQTTGNDAGDEGEEEEDAEEASQSADEARSFEMVLKNGLVVRLQAYDVTARKEWIRRLRRIVRYWQLRIAADTETYKEVRRANLDKLEIDEEMESYLGQYAQKWEVSRAQASPELFNVCSISCCRPVTMSGVLYRKPRLHSNFKKCNVILSHGRLLIFQSTLRKRSGREVSHIHHERQEILDLRDTYIYSGLATEDDLLYHNTTFDSNHPGHRALPRVYLEDNLTSIDEDSTICFVIWHGKKKSFFRANMELEDGRLKQQLRYVSSLGSTGRTVVFKTRSRTERDQWVMKINMEIERLQQGEDMRMVPKK